MKCGVAGDSVNDFAEQFLKCRRHEMFIDTLVALNPSAHLWATEHGAPNGATEGFQ